MKGKKSLLNYEERKSYLQAIKYVDLIIPENNWEQKIEDIKKNHVDIFTMGDDWKGKFDFMSDVCQVHYLERTPSISSTMIRSKINEIKSVA